MEPGAALLALVGRAGFHCFTGPRHKDMGQMSEITQEQFTEFEKHHEALVWYTSLLSALMNLPSCVPSQNDVALLMLAREDKDGGAFEECAMRCLLTPAAPAANRATLDTEAAKQAAATPAKSS